VDGISQHYAEHPKEMLEKMLKEMPEERGAQLT
jgi:hypothetical protein